MKILSSKKWNELLGYVVTTLMNLPERNNLLWALIHDMDGEENLDIVGVASSPYCRLLIVN